MAIPLIAAGAIAAGAGLAGAIGGSAAGVGKNAYRATNFGDTTQYDPNRFYYGGTPGGAHEAASRYAGGAGWAQTRDAPHTDFSGAQPNYSLADQDRFQSGRARFDQERMAGLMDARARGLVPSIAGQQSAEDIRRLQEGAREQGRQVFAAQRAGAASARGAAGLAIADQTAANNIANAHGAIGAGTAAATRDISNQAQINAAQERLDAEQAAFGAYGGMRQGDFQAGGLAQDRAHFGADLRTKQGMFDTGVKMQQRGLNDQFSLGMTGFERGVRDTEMTGGMNQQGLLSGSLGNQQGINAGITGNNANTSFNYMKMGVGAVTSGAGMAMPTPKAEGGPVEAGKSYLVGERGPEIIVPKADGLVIPNHALPRGRRGEDYGFRTAQASMDRALAEKEEERRALAKTFDRDTSVDRQAVADRYYADISRRADEEIAGMRRSLGQGASVARYEGEVDQAGPPTWLADYMQTQEPRGLLAAREEGGPVRGGQPVLVGEAGPEEYVSVDDLAQRIEGRPAAPVEAGQEAPHPNPLPLPRLPPIGADTPRSVGRVFAGDPRPAAQQPGLVPPKPKADRAAIAAALAKILAVPGLAPSALLALRSQPTGAR